MEQITKRLMNWASILEPSTRAQAERASRMPFIYPHLALMPDAHLGKGATVGSVIPTLGAIMPAAVGVDIGCGMIAVRTQYLADDFAHRDLRPLREAIEKAIPSSAGSYNIDIKPSTATRLVELRQLAKDADFDPASYAANWELQLGTLGSGNVAIQLGARAGGSHGPVVNSSVSASSLSLPHLVAVSYTHLRAHETDSYLVF